MRHDDPAGHRGRLLAALRLQYPDAVAADGYRLLHPETGDPYTGQERHLVATCRATANFATGCIADGPDWCREAAEHGLSFLRERHLASAGGYHLVVDENGEPVDATRSAYGHAFVLLAYARAAAAGVERAREWLTETADLLDERFREPNGLLRSDCDPDWTEREPYRGQNANMHACEAFLAAYEATDETAYLDSARTIAHELTVELAAETDGLLWEHYTADWDHDFAYNADRPRHQFRPPGYQPGHHAEWAKLLALLDRYDDASGAETPDGGWYDRAVALFDAAVDMGWQGDGFVYTVDRDGEVLVPDRYGWAVAEAIGATAALAERARTHGDTPAAKRFATWHGRLVDTAARFRGPAGLWYERYRVDRTDTDADADGGEPVAPDPPGVEPDYHPLGAWFESWRSVGDGPG